MAWNQFIQCVFLLNLLCFGSPSWAEIQISDDFSAEERQLLIDDLNTLFSLIEVTELTPYHQQVFAGPPSGATYKVYLESMISRIEPDFSGKVCGVNMKACAGFTGQAAPAPIWLGSFYFRKDLLQYERIVLLMHEARHNLNIPHDALCFGQSKCDARVDGAWGAEFLFVLHMLLRFDSTSTEYSLWEKHLQMVSANFRKSALDEIETLMRKCGLDPRAIVAIRKYWIEPNGE